MPICQQVQLFTLSFFLNFCNVYFTNVSIIDIDCMFDKIIKNFFAIIYYNYAY